MNVTLVMATSLNGRVAGENDDTGWILDFDSFYQTVAGFGICVMGKRTYLECVKYNVFPYKGALNIVMTHDNNLRKMQQENALFTDAAPEEILAIAGEKGFKKLLVIGGGHVNGSFLKAGLIDEIILDIHPVIVGRGIALFEGEFPDCRLVLEEMEKLDNQLVRVRYRIIK